MKKYTIEEMQEMVETGEAVYLGGLGIFNRPVYQVGEDIFRQHLLIDSEREFVPGDFYKASKFFGQSILNVLIKGD